MRIVGGRLKGRALAAPKSALTRPTSDRLRETLFNVLAHGYDDPVRDARVIDLFAGTGALGLEALSRGAAFGLFVETGVEARGVLRGNVETLGLGGVTKIHRRDALDMGPRLRFEPFTLAFLDPPYGQGYGPRTLTALTSGGWLAPGALCVLEEAREVEIEEIAGFETIERRPQGAASLTFLRTT